MKFLNNTILFLIIWSNSSAQNSSWKEVRFNEILSFSLPVDFQSSQAGYVRAVAGQLNSNYFGFQYADTIMASIKDSDAFRISLVGFLSGRASDSTLKGYKAIVKDTTLGGTVGLMAKFTTNDLTKHYKQVYYFATMANDRFCWFYAFATAKENIGDVSVFFNAIQFDTKNVKESKFQMEPVHLEKEQL
jgi:hypothetical protein